MSFSWKDEIEQVLLQYDVLGSSGCYFGHPRQSMLVSIQECSLMEDHLHILFDQWSPEGWGLTKYPQDNFEIPADVKLNTSLHLLWDIQKSPPDLYTPIWILGLVESDDMIFDFQTTGDTTWLEATGARHTYGTLRLLELCSGGFGGWQMAARFLGHSSERKTSTVAIEQDIHAATAYAIAHRPTMLRSAPDRDAFVRYLSPLDWVLVASVLDKSWWPAVSRWQPHVISISAPCQPWSGAAHGDGLCRQDGQLLIHCICMSRFFRAPILLIEQVLGFSQHPHKPWVVKALHMIGYKLVFDKCLDLQDQAATTRIRWIGIAVRVQAQLPSLPMPIWPRFEYITVQQMDPNVAIPDSHRALLQVGDHIKYIAQSLHFFRGNKTSQTEEGLLKSRTHEHQPKVPTFMASYGSQHKFDPDYLGKYGYFGHFRADLTYPFGWSPWRCVS